MNDLRDYDAIVVGAGGSGLAAAVSAAEHGLSVLLIERRPAPGGTTGIAVGSFTANQTRMQERAGVEDSLEHHAEDAGKFAPPEVESRNHDPLRRFFLSESAATLEWLQSMGLAFHGPSPEPPNRVPRMHNVVPGARAYIDTLHARFVKLGGRLLCETSVEKLVRSGRQVIGVAAKTPTGVEEFHASRGVVLAAGDYANSPELIGRYKGDRFANIEGINPHATGAGHWLVKEAGGQLVNMDVTYGPELRFVAPRERSLQDRLPTRGPIAAAVKLILPLVPEALLQRVVKRLLVTWQHPEDALLDDGAILVNREGKRFCNELLSPDREVAVAGETQKECYFLLDARLVERYSAWPHFIPTAPKIAYAYVEDYERLRPDITARANSLAGVAAGRGLSPSAIQATVTQYNDAVSLGTTDPWGREQREQLVDRGDWVLLGPAKAYFTTTEGGAAINEQFQVLDALGEPIEGLYAVGQNGLGGQILWGHGLHIAWAMTSGRLVGKVLGATVVRG